ncbi:hypothetical protein F4678DRAFT_439246 [Xylaria arbuscula]|nr:hypothetical protein F4678DRAFT_439246 [Xylaria arbuscula]
MLDQYLCPFASLDFDNLSIYCDWGCHETQPILVQALYRFMKRAAREGFGYLGGRKASADDLHNYLLTKALFSRQIASVQWLVSQGAGTPGYLSSDKDVLEQAVGNALYHMYDDDMWYTVCFLVTYGASTLSRKTKEKLARKFEVIYHPMTYEESKQTVTSDMLQPQYFVVKSPDRLRPLCHYLLEKCSALSW